MSGNHLPVFCKDCKERFEPIDRNSRGHTVETRCPGCQCRYRINLANQWHNFARLGMQTEKPSVKGVW